MARREDCVRQEAEFSVVLVEGCTAVEFREFWMLHDVGGGTLTPLASLFELLS